MISVVCSAIIQRGDSFLMVKETKSSAAGKWSLPGGKLEEGESIVEGVCREVQEETGYNVKKSELVGVINKPLTHEGNSVVKFIFSCDISYQPVRDAEHEHEFIAIDSLRKLSDKELIRGKEIISLLESRLQTKLDATPFLQII